MEELEKDKAKEISYQISSINLSISFSDIIILLETLAEQIITIIQFAFFSPFTLA